MLSGEFVPQGLPTVYDVEDQPPGNKPLELKLYVDGVPGATSKPLKLTGVVGHVIVPGDVEKESVCACSIAPKATIAVNEIQCLKVLKFINV